jgi:hypothetical protein
LVRHLRRDGHWEKTTNALAMLVFMRPGKLRARSLAQAMSWVRNSARKPIALGLIERTDRGVFRVTAAGRRATESK